MVDIGKTRQKHKIASKNPRLIVREVIMRKKVSVDIILGSNIVNDYARYLLISVDKGRSL